MSDMVPRVKNETNIGQLISVALVILAGAVAWGKSQSDIGAMAQRVEAGEKRDEKTTEKLDAVQGSIIELKSDNRSIKADIDRQGRQLDRQGNQLDQILQLLRSQPQPPQPPPRVP